MMARCILACLCVLTACGSRATSEAPAPSSPLDQGKVGFGALRIGTPVGELQKVLPAAVDARGQLAKGPYDWHGVPLSLALHDGAIERASLTFPSAAAARSEIDKRAWGPPSMSWKDGSDAKLRWDSVDPANAVVAVLSGSSITFSARATGWLGSSPLTSRPGALLGKGASAVERPFVANVLNAVPSLFLDTSVVLSVETKLSGVQLHTDAQLPSRRTSGGEQRVSQITFSLTSCEPLVKAWSAPARSTKGFAVWQTPTDTPGITLTTIAHNGATCRVVMTLTADSIVDRDGHFWFERPSSWAGRTLTEIDRLTPGLTIEQPSKDMGDTVMVQPLAGVTAFPGQEAQWSVTLELSFDGDRVCGYSTILNTDGKVGTLAAEVAPLLSEACRALGGPLKDDQCERDGARIARDPNRNALIVRRECPSRAKPGDVRTLVGSLAAP